MPPSSRLLAIEVLNQWQQTGQPIDHWLEPRLQILADARDRNLLKAMVFGTLRRRGALDWIIARLSSTPISRLKPAVLQALRIGAYQLLFLERVPPSAAIHATVEAIKAMGEPRWLTGFVNGVLRNIGRQHQELVAQLQAGKVPAEALYNHPSWLLKRWKDRYGSQGMAAICQHNNETAKLCIRINTARITVVDFLNCYEEQHIQVEQGLYLPEAVWLAQVGAITELPGYEQGWFFVQDEAAQLVARLLLPMPPGNCLDGCAGLGGKTATLATLLPRESRVMAVEPDHRRQQLFRENMTRLGLGEISLHAGSLGEYAAKTDSLFSAVLIDAPCSGLGVTGRHPDIRWQRQEEELMLFQSKQVAILQEAAPLVAPGGVLVYATCSTEPEENDAVVARFQAACPGFLLEDAALSLPAAARHLVDAQGFLRTIPGLQGGDGFFGVRFRRSG